MGGRTIVSIGPVDVIIGYRMCFGGVLYRLGNFFMDPAGSAGCPKLATGLAIHRLLVVLEGDAVDGEGLHRRPPSGRCGAHLRVGAWDRAFHARSRGWLRAGDEPLDGLEGAKLLMAAVGSG